MASITKRGKRWRAMIRRKGVSASQTFPTRYEAQAWAAEQEDRISRGLTGKASNRPFGDALERFRLEVSPNRNGAKWERLRLLALEFDPIARIPLCDLGPADFADWRDRRSREVSAWSVDREMTILRTVIERARTEWEWLLSNPMHGVKRPKTPTGRNQRISAADEKKILAALHYDGMVSTQQHHVAVAFLFALETGMRAGEIVSLTTGAVQGRVARLTRTKNGDDRDVPLSLRAVDLLALLPARDGVYFPISTDTLSTMFRRAKQAAGLPIRFHDTRHEACTRLAQKIGVLDLARMIGHRDLKSLMTYYNPTAAEIAARLD